MGTQALRNIQLTKFSGRSEDWAAFARDWERYIKLQHESTGNDGPLPNLSTLMHLKNYLDDASKLWLEAEWQKNSELAYYDFYDMLRQRHGKDMQIKHRQNWLKVTLQHNGQKPSLQEWDIFTAKYLQQRNLVEDWAEAEDRQQIQRQLTRELQGWLIDEQFKRREKNHQVKIQTPEDHTAEEVRKDFENSLGIALTIVSADRKQVTVDCSSEDIVNYMLTYNGGKWHGITPLTIKKSSTK